MKMKKILYVLFLLMILSSCSESGYDDYYYIKNDLDYPIMVSRYDYNNISDTMIVNSNEMILYLSVNAIGSSSFDNDNNSICITQNTFIFNDSVSITYKPSDTYKKNPCMSHCWEIINEESKKKLTSHKVLYTITEEDYQNAISQE